MKQRTNNEWIAALSLDGSIAQREAFAQLGAFLHRVAYQRIGRRGASLPGLTPLSAAERSALAQDIVQQALVRIYQRLDQYRGEGRFLSWATTVTVRLVGEELRKADWQTFRFDSDEQRSTASADLHWFSLVLSDGDLLPEQRTVMREMWQVISLAVESDLSEQQRVAFLARFVDGLSNAEIARLAHVEPSVIYQRIHQARLKIKRRLVAAGYEKWELA